MQRIMHRVALQRGSIAVNPGLFSSRLASGHPSSSTPPTLHASHMPSSTIRSLSNDAASTAPPIDQMPVHELVELLAAGNPTEALLVDVREPHELDLAALPGFALHPLSTFGQWAPLFVDKVAKDAEVICLCHHGVRSMNFAVWLRQNGYTNLRNVVGGIDAVARVDGKTPRY